jgi:repressor LexA
MEEGQVKGLTDKQQAIVDFIRTQREQGQHPTVRQIGEHMGIRSPNGVAVHLKLLEKKGMVWRGVDGKLVTS